MHRYTSTTPNMFLLLKKTRLKDIDGEKYREPPIIARFDNHEAILNDEAHELMQKVLNGPKAEKWRSKVHLSTEKDELENLKRKARSKLMERTRINTGAISVGSTMMPSEEEIERSVNETLESGD